MLSVSPLGSTKDEEGQGEMERLSMESHVFGDLSDGNLLESISFDDIFVGINDGDVLPDLEMDPEIFADFSLSTGEDSEMATSSLSVENFKVDQNIATSTKKEEEDKVSSDSGSGSGSNSGDEIVSRRDESVAVKPSQSEVDKGRKSSAESKNSRGKRKVKVDWTPELHRRFVQAVEQLGVDKAVPSRILEIMGIDCLTRHNIASHLQKYRSHRKHLLAREAEAANWNKRRQCYGIGGGGGGGKREGSPWLAVAPTMGFPPVTPPPPMQHFGALHVWGHPTMDHSFMPLWPKHLPPHSPSPPPPLAWASPAPPPPDPSYWHQPATNALTPGTPCFPQPLTTARFPSPPVPGIPPLVMYKVDPGIAVPTGQPAPRPLIDFHPSKESVDAAIGDVLSKPWLPLPLGLKAPALDSVMGELQRQGIPKIPPSCA
ncbi:probable transcription factor GLK1 [Prosopis cineraria]|uniref:probable transcription factor GLK1 n=1 Tax=Prosopis cineraria TaxID=364024 RepID=UPI00240EF9D8|nr:probable transcription factor GLK1 [Prosopis cineraria]XP_054814651.1 probable transcription factor GLK1 [Prosopis cineraria]